MSNLGWLDYFEEIVKQKCIFSFLFLKEASIKIFIDKQIGISRFQVFIRRLEIFLSSISDSGSSTTLLISSFARIPYVLPFYVFTASTWMENSQHSSSRLDSSIKGAARQGIKMKSLQLQPQHSSIIEALFRH